jgi:hypothetical protein
VTIEQVGSDVEATSNAGGEFNLAGLTQLGTGGFIGPAVIPSVGNITFANPNGSGTAYAGAPLCGCNPFSGPTNFGSGGTTKASSFNNGPVVSMQFNGSLTVPVGYTSGTALATDQEIFNNTTLAMLGITSGTYKQTWGTGADQSFTVVAGTPLPATLPLFATGLGALGLLGWRRKRKATASLLGGN